jgi:hypothetical protein
MYRSNLEHLHDQGPEALAYEGTLGKLVDDLYDVHLGFRSQHTTPKHLRDFCLHPARILRGAIDYNIANSYNAESFAATALKFAKEIAKGSIRLKDIKDIDNEIFIYGLRNAIVKEDVNEATWEAIQPARSYATARRLYDDKHRRGSKLLLIALAHSAVRSAIDICHSYKRLDRRSESIVMEIARCTRENGVHSKLHLSPEALKRVKSLAKERTVVIYDTLMNYGRTANFALDELSALKVKGPFYFEANLISPAITEALQLQR